ncbi:VOC family protein [Nocardia sp. NPDC050793]|uniref:VOC family protein n=1 Tax=Nocardia sp. NPDC050793 TaxID=3155159 RepID=UPI0033F6605F
MQTIERVEDHIPPDWPGNRVPKQMHLDLFVTDLDIAEKAAIDCGAVKAQFQPAPDRWRVLLDLSGHPFCLTVPPGTQAGRASPMVISKRLRRVSAVNSSSG